MENKTSHTDQQWQALAAHEPDGPVYMVNLLKFRARAAYSGGRDADLSGFAAYQRYAEPMAALIEASGGRVVHSSVVSGLVVGAVAELWDVVAIVQYPSRREFIALIETDQVQALQVHRLAGLEGQLNIVTEDPTPA
ncbi:MAG: DUF1330 domain-containing protein [Pseudomonadota bacterium]